MKYLFRVICLLCVAQQSAHCATTTSTPGPRNNAVEEPQANVVANARPELPLEPQVVDNTGGNTGGTQQLPTPAVTTAGPQIVESSPTSEEQTYPHQTISKLCTNEATTETCVDVSSLVAQVRAADLTAASEVSTSVAESAPGVAATTLSERCLAKWTDMLCVPPVSDCELELLEGSDESLEGNAIVVKECTPATDDPNAQPWSVACSRGFGAQGAEAGQTLRWSAEWPASALRFVQNTSARMGSGLNRVLARSR